MIYRNINSEQFAKEIKTEVESADLVGKKVVLHKYINGDYIVKADTEDSAKVFFNRVKEILDNNEDNN